MANSTKKDILFNGTTTRKFIFPDFSDFYVIFIGEYNGLQEEVTGFYKRLTYGLVA
jgi:hypothetical protein